MASAKNIIMPSSCSLVPHQALKAVGRYHLHICDKSVEAGSPRGATHATRDDPVDFSVMLQHTIFLWSQQDPRLQQGFFPLPVRFMGYI